MGKITILDELTINKIAAGEVVERPAAVVKELVENALDAGAKKIDVSITGGGLASIRVVDDGEGMAPEDVPLSVQRHATSKIRAANDLFAIHTLGFRGEALPSIASVSRMRIVTRRAKDLTGTLLEIHGGRVVRQDEAGCPAGTEVRVEDLFYNTPARLKFIKSEGAEAARITEAVRRLALAWPEVSFSYTANGRCQFTTAGSGSIADTVLQVLGARYGRRFITLSWQGPTLSLSGCLGRPELAASNRNLQYFFVNRRPVHSPLLSDALQTAYQTLLPRHRFPAAVVYIETDPTGVDVNVHPAKREVRFASERDVYRQVLTGVRQALESTSLAREAVVTPSIKEMAATACYRPNPGERNEWLQQALSFHGTCRTVELAREEGVFGTGDDVALPELRILGQHLGTYIIGQAANGDLYIVDQHAAHERVLYEQIIKEYCQGFPPVQEIIPQVMELDAKAAAALQSSLKIFAEMGLSIENFGNNTFILRSIPLFFRDSLKQGDILDLVTAVTKSYGETSPFVEAIKLLACKAAVKANQQLEREEMTVLLNGLARTKLPFTCPHGRPTVMVLTPAMLAAGFGRR